MKIKKIFFIILFILGSAQITSAERTMNEMPMYGGKHNPTVEQNKEFSKSAAKLGWKYYYKGDLDAAIKRFNQAWMFDRESADAFWGFGLIMGRRAGEENTEKNLNESVKFLEKAHQLSKKNPRIMVDLAFSETLLGYFLKENQKPLFQEHFNKARILFQKAEKLERNYPLIYSNWSVLEFYEGNYSAAKSRLDFAKKLGFKPDPNYEKELKEKLKQ